MILSWLGYQRVFTGRSRTRALTRTRTGVGLTILEACIAGEVSIASPFKASILSSGSDTSALRVCVLVLAGSVQCVLVGWWYEEAGGVMLSGQSDGVSVGGSTPRQIVPTNQGVSSWVTGDQLTVKTNLRSDPL